MTATVPTGYQIRCFATLLESALGVGTAKISLFNILMPTL
jgi:hypothetical protein